MLTSYLPDSPTVAAYAKQLLMQWAYASAFRFSSAVTDSNGAIQSGSVVWPDGTAGTFTTDVASTAFPGAIDAWHATYGVGNVVRTITQPLVTRDSTSGFVKTQPEITIV